MHRLPSLVAGALLVAATLLVAAPPALAVDDGQIGIRPLDEPDYFHVELAPGAATERIAVISNHTTSPATLLTYPVDGLTTPQGGFAFAARADPPKSVGAWTRLQTDEVVVPPQGEVRVPFTITVPPGATPGDYYGGLVMQSPPVTGDTVTVDGGTAVQLNIVQRQAVRIYLTVSGSRNDELRTGALSWNRNGSEVTFSLPLRNTGNTTLHPAGTLTIDSTIGVNRAVEFNTPESLLPGGAITLHATIHNAPPIQLGVATATAESEAGTVRATAEFTEIPWGILVGIVAAIGLLAILGYRTARFVRRARRAIALTEGGDR